MRVWKELPSVGLGTWKIAKEDTAKTIDLAMEIGYRAFDCACDYANEQEVGVALKEAMKKHGVDRSELFITSKLWCTFMEPQHVQEACERTLNDLQLEYLDLYLIHFPIALKYVDPKVRYPPGWAFDPTNPQPNDRNDAGLIYSNATIRETWEAMEQLVSLGLVKNIGVANFNPALLTDLLKYAKIRPKVNQIELHPYLAHDALLKLCKREGVQVTAFHSFGGQSLLELGNELAQQTPALLQHPEIQRLSEKYKKTTAQVLLRWALERGATVIPKSSNPDRLRENFDVCDGFHLDEQDMESLAALDKNLHFNDPKDFADTPIW